MVTQTNIPFPVGHGDVTVTTKHNRQVHIRHLVLKDVEMLVEFFYHLSPETRRLRFINVPPSPPKDLITREAERLVALDPLRQAALVGTIQEDGCEHAVGVSRLAIKTDEPEAAEFAIVIRDDYQKEGLGTILFDLLLQIALVRGLKRMVGLTLAENHGIHRLVRQAGLPVTSKTSRGETTLTISLSDSANS